MSQPDQIFIGRQPELSILTIALDDALAGRGQIVMLAGEPGIGKTRLAQEIAGFAERRGAQVLWGWCYEREGAPPYWPWVQPIQSYVTEASADRLRVEMGPGAADIAELVPEIREKLPDLQPSPALDPQQTRFRLFNSIATFLKNLAQSQSLVLVLEDLHWADTASLILLEFLAQQIAESKILVIGIYRDIEVTRQHPLTESLARLSRSPAFHRLALSGLGLDHVGLFVRAAGGENASIELINAIHAHTEGNPFFMTEVVRLLRERGELSGNGQPAPGPIQIPDGVKEAIGQRLNRLSVACNDVLTSASIIGREYDFRLLSRVESSLQDDRLLEVIDEALNSHLIEEIPGSGERYQFSHALVQQYLAESLSASRRVRLHALIGESLEELYGEDVDAHAGELAYHFTQAASIIGADKQVRYALIAGERALAAFAHEEALTLFLASLNAREHDPMDSEKAAILFGLGRAQAATRLATQGEESTANMSQAFEYFAQSGDIDQAVAVAESALHSPLGERTRTADLVTKALSLVLPDSYHAGRLLSIYGRVLGLERGDYAGARQAFDRALAIAKREGDLALEMRTLANAARVSHFNSNYEEAVDLGRQAILLSRQTDEPESETTAYYVASISFGRIGNLREAKQYAAAFLSAAEKLRDSFWLSGALWRNAASAYFEGDWQIARDFSDRGFEVSPTDSRNLLTRILLEYETGNFKAGEEYLERLLDVKRLTPPGPSFPHVATALVIAATARITGEDDRIKFAKDAAETALSSREGDARLALGLIAVLRGDVALAQEHYPGIEPIRGLITATISGDRILGLLACSMGNLDQAQQHFEDASAFCRNGGYRPELAWTCYDYSDTLVRRGAAGDRAKAKSLLDESLIISTELGMRPLMERVATLRERAETLPVEPPAYPDGLTAREVEVLRLVAAGKTNQEIADALVITLRTAGNHVANILNKTGTANRTEAASYAHTHGLITDKDPAGLTRREIEVLQLICGGKTDREIGRELFISVNTVGNHVRNILSKTASANRAEAATYAARHGLVTDGDSTSD